MMRDRPQRVNLVSMTRTPSIRNSARSTTTPVVTGRWRLQDAKARFSELVRSARNEGPQTVTLHDREAVVVVDAQTFKLMQGADTGQRLIDALQQSPHRDSEIEPARQPMPVRDVSL